MQSNYADTHSCSIFLHFGIKFMGLTTAMSVKKAPNVSFTEAKLFFVSLVVQTVRHISSQTTQI